MRNLLKTLTGIAATGIVAGVMVTGAWAQAPAKAPAYKDQGESDIVVALQKETDLVKKVGIGTRVRMVFSDVTDGLSLPQWTIDETAAQPEKPWRYAQE